MLLRRLAHVPPGHKSVSLCECDCQLINSIDSSSDLSLRYPRTCLHSCGQSTQLSSFVGNGLDPFSKWMLVNKFMKLCLVSWTEVFACTSPSLSPVSERDGLGTERPRPETTARRTYRETSNFVWGMAVMVRFWWGKFTPFILFLIHAPRSSATGRWHPSF